MTFGNNKPTQLLVSLIPIIGPRAAKQRDVREARRSLLAKIDNEQRSSSLAELPPAHRWLVEHAAWCEALGLGWTQVQTILRAALNERHPLAEHFRTAVQSRPTILDYLPAAERRQVLNGFYRPSTHQANDQVILATANGQILPASIELFVRRLLHLTPAEWDEHRSTLFEPLVSLINRQNAEEAYLAIVNALGQDHYPPAGWNLAQESATENRQDVEWFRETIGFWQDPEIERDENCPPPELFPSLTLGERLQTYPVARQILHCVRETVRAQGYAFRDANGQERLCRLGFRHDGSAYIGIEVPTSKKTVYSRRAS